MTRIAIFAALTFGGVLSLRAGDISVREAQRLATSYSLCVVRMGCGGVGTPILHGTSWEVPVSFGFAGHTARQHPCGQSFRLYFIQLWRSSLSYTVPEAAYPTRR